jgi:3-oxoacyl-[acyl-carrier-protein] synthase-3
MASQSIMIKSTGSYVPEKVLTNADLEKIVDTTDEWIIARTGIKTRRIAAKHEATSDLAYEASKIALERAELEPKDIDLILVGTITPDMFFPSTGCFLQERLGAKNATAMDISAACSGYIYALVIANNFITTNTYKNALIVGAEKLTSIVDWEDRSTCVIFADGAGASVIVPSNGSSKLLAFDMGTDGGYSEQLYIPGGGSRNPSSIETVTKKMHAIKMNGNTIFKVAVNKMRETFINSMKKAGITANDISLLIPHQANLRIIESLRKFLHLPKEKVYVNIDKYGNTSAASIAIALDEAIGKGLIKRGDIIGFAAFGGGLTWGSAIIQY